MSDQAALAPGAGRVSLWRPWLMAGLLLVLAAPVSAASLNVAVASNFLAPLEALAKAYREHGGGSLRISAGATGQLYAQITQGAPYDVFLAADQARPRRLVDEGTAVAGSRMTYAREALRATGRWAMLSDRIVQAQNVGQALQYLATGNVSHALVAASYTRLDNRPGGEVRRVAARDYAPIRQDAVILMRAATPDQARDFLAFMQTAAAEVLRSYGYRPGGASP